MEQINKLFIKFLKDNHALKQYIKNLKKYNTKQFRTWENHTNPFTIVSLRKYLDSNRPNGLIMNSFLWIDTLEGHYFWEDLDTKWRMLLKQINK